MAQRRRPSPRHSFAAALFGVAFALAGCSSVPGEAATSTQSPASRVARVPGTNLKRVVLNPTSAARIGIKTELVREAPANLRPSPAGVARSVVVPVSAVLYDKDGGTWVYTVSAPLTYVRQRVTIASIAGDLAVLAAGPAPGSSVVTVGAVELLGTEYGVEGQ